MLGMFTLIGLGFLVLIFNPAIPITREITDAAGVTTTVHGAFALGTSAEPILDGFRAIFASNAAGALAVAAVIGLVASFHAIIFASGRQIYSLSRAGYFPHFLSVTHGEHKTPNIALVAGAAVGLAVMLVVWFAMGGERAGAFIGGVLLNMAVFGAMFSYLLQGLTFIQLRRRFPHIERPYRSPFGVVGAALTVHHRAGDHRLSACRSALPHRSDRRVDLVCDSDRLLRGAWPEAARAVAGGGVRREAPQRRGFGLGGGCLQRTGATSMSNCVVSVGGECREGLDDVPRPRSDRYMSANDPKRTSVPVIRANTRRGAHDSTTIVISNVPHSKVAKDQATVEAGMRRAGKQVHEKRKQRGYSFLPWRRWQARRAFRLLVPMKRKPRPCSRPCLITSPRRRQYRLHMTQLLRSSPTRSRSWGWQVLVR